MKQKVIKKQFNSIKQANHASSELLEHLKNNYTFLSEEEKQINTLQKHLLNMNVLFTDLEKGMLKNDKVNKH